MIEVKSVTIHVNLNLGRFVNPMLGKHTRRTGFDSMIGTFMARVCCGLKVPNALPQVETVTLLMWDDTTTDKVQQFLSTIIAENSLNNI